MTGEFGDDPGRGAQEGDARSREGDLGSGCEGHHAVLGPRLTSDLEDVRELVALVIEVVHAVGVVPEDTEVRRGRRHRGEPPHDLLGVGDARGVRVLRHAPDALDRVVGGCQALDLIHVGALGGHGHGDVLDAQIV